MAWDIKPKSYPICRSAEGRSDGQPVRSFEASCRTKKKAGRLMPVRLYRVFVNDQIAASRIMVLVSRYGRRPSRPPSRPTPDCLKPPKAMPRSVW